MNCHFVALAPDCARAQCSGLDRQDICFCTQPPVVLSCHVMYSSSGEPNGIERITTVPAAIAAAQLKLACVLVRPWAESHPVKVAEREIFVCAP